MTNTTPRTGGSGPEDTRLQELLRADAAAVVDDDLDDETPTYPSHRPPDSAGHPAASHAPSQVYSIRVPVDRLEQVRRLASERNVAPTTMLRQWVLAQLDQELGTAPSGSRAETHAAPGARTEHHAAKRRVASTDRLEAMTAALAEVAANLTKSLTLVAEICANQNAAFTQPMTAHVRALPSQSIPLAASNPGFSPFLRTNPVTQTPVSYLSTGLAALRSTIADASTLPGIAGTDLYHLYEAADEEFSTS
ncbi:MAG TPA: hypothetical protein VF070_16105 [Streptosporangiaceae bacterium]